MGGIAILVGMWTGYLGSHLIGIGYGAEGVSASALLVLGLATALGVVGFLADYIKLRQRRNLGLTATGKYIGQLTAAIIFGVLVLRFPSSTGLTPGSRALSYVRDTSIITLGSRDHRHHPILVAGRNIRRHRTDAVLRRIPDGVNGQKRCHDGLFSTANR
ncbi:hypothetical protein IU501_21020 [Nocardia otitidiscaviarum]|nr:hypothetical protein [Nocardia otitidiscaviarum]MBF6487288.1 hypothetical protein [Nocardia otitidiscaviarum]